MTHPALTSEAVAVITGGASGIGLATAKDFAGRGMRLVIVDRNEEALEKAEAELTVAGAQSVMLSAADVSDRGALEELQNKVMSAFGAPSILMNNAGIGRPSSCLEPLENWEATLGVNLWGAINGVQVFGPSMLSSGKPGAIINTGSKQGITTPPGNPAYNVSKAGLKAFTEALAHELRNTEGSEVTAHLLVPGFVHTPMVGLPEKHPSAWTAEQTAAFFIESLNKGDFYIICPDNDVPRALDEKRMAWAIGDIIENRPPLSRWHPDYADAFTAFVQSD